MSRLAPGIVDLTMFFLSTPLQGGGWHQQMTQNACEGGASTYTLRAQLDNPTTVMHSADVSWKKACK